MTVTPWARQKALFRAHIEPDMTERCLSMWTEGHPEPLVFKVVKTMLQVIFCSEKLGWLL